MTSDYTVSMDEFLTSERTARAETEAAIAACESIGDIVNADRARITLALIDRAVIVANGGNLNH